MACTGGIETPHTFLTLDPAACLVEEYVGGAKRTSLVSKYEVHRQTMDAHIRRARATRSPKVTSEALAEYAEGVSAMVVARQRGPADTITRQPAWRDSRPGHANARLNRWTRFMALAGQGLSFVRISTQVGVPASTIRDALTASAAH